MKKPKFESVFKYCSVNTAEKILAKNSVLLNTPNQFNDPYDTDIVFDKKDLKSAAHIVINYTLDLAMMKELREHYHTLPLVQKIIAAPAKLRFKLNDITNKKFQEYRPTINYSRMLEIFTRIGLKNGKPGSESQVALENIMQLKNDRLIETELEKLVSDKSKELLISCFSKVEDSILMWAHYADNNKGICIEFENEVFLEMFYSSVKSSLKIKKLMYKVLWHHYEQSKFEINENHESKYMLSILPFLTKSDDWEYEKEVRCILSKTNSKAILQEDNRYYYSMKRIKSIILGCRVSSDDRDKIIKIAESRNLPIYEMVLSKDTYKLEKKQVNLN